MVLLRSKGTKEGAIQSVDRSDAPKTSTSSKTGQILGKNNIIEGQMAITS